MPDTKTFDEWKPDADAIAAWLRSRTGVRSNAGPTIDQGPGTGAFTDKTVETTGRVESLVNQEGPVVVAVVGTDCPAQLAGLAAQVVGYRVCAVISADGRNGRTEPDWWTDQADKLLDTLRGLAADIGSGDEPGPGDNTGLMAGSFTPSPLLATTCSGQLVPRPL